MPELIFRIDDKETCSLRIFIEETGALRKRILYLSTLKELARPEEQDLLTLFVKLQRRFGTSLETMSFQQIDVELSQAEETLRRLIRTGKLFCNGKRLNGAQAEWIWQGESLSPDACRVEAFLKSEQEIPFTACSWILPSVCAVADHVLYFAKTSVRPGAFVLEGVARRRFLEEDVKIQWKVREEAPLEVFPQLMLHDPTGCFADLWMHYRNVGRVAFSDLAPQVYPDLPETWNLERAKAPGFDDRNSPHISNMRRVAIVESRELSRGSKSKFLADRGIGGRKRLKEAEGQWEKDLLEAGFLRKQVGRSPYYCPGDKVHDALRLLLEVGWDIFDEKGKSIVRLSGWNGGAQQSGPHLILQGVAQFQDRTASLRSVLDAVKQGRQWIDLGEKTGWIDRKETLQLFGDLLEEEWDGEAMRVPQERIGACLPLREAFRWELPEWTGGWELSPQGEGFRGTLFSYQQKGVDWLSFLHRYGLGGLLADEMGLGKTVQLLAFFSRLRTNLPILVVAPTSLLYHWQSEFKRFLPQMVVKVHAGKDRTDLKGAQAIITSYGILRQDERLFSEVEWEVAALDESNAIKNEGTKTFQSVSVLKARCRVCMSGTPIENRTEELASQFSFLMPRLTTLHETADGLRRKTRPFFLRRRKCDVELQLPEKVDQISWVEMDEAQQAVYEEFQTGAVSRLRPLVEQDGANAHRMEILEAILRLRQICCDPRLVGREGFGVKLERMLEDVDSLLAEGRKILIYSQFTSMLDQIAREFDKRNWNFLRLDGSTAAAARAECVRRFQEDPHSCLFLLSLKAGGVGLNLTAADDVFLFDPWWNDAVEQQAIDRAHRIGRQKSVFIKRYVVCNSIEEKMLELKRKKSRLAEQVLDGSGDPESLDAEELFDIL